MANGLFGGGDGTAEDPYLVEDAADMDAVRNFKGSHFKQTADIDLSSWGEWLPYAGYSTVTYKSTYWYGSYDGNNFSIINMHFGPDKDVYDQSMFGYIYNADYYNEEEGIVYPGDMYFKNMRFKNFNVNEQLDAVACLATDLRIWGTTKIEVSNCILEMNIISDDYTAALFSEISLFDGTVLVISNIKANLDVTYAGNNFGGMIAVSNLEDNASLIIADSSVKCKAVADNNSGGFLGDIFMDDYEGVHTTSVLIERCFVEVDLTATNSPGGFIGDLYPGVDSTVRIKDCYAKGILRVLDYGGWTSVGGFMASFYDSNKGVSDTVIENCYSDVLLEFHYSDGQEEVNQEYTGGIVGYVQHFDDGRLLNIVSSYYNQDNNGVFLPHKGTPKTAELMKQQATFINWDFESVWKIREGVTYPMFELPIQVVKCKAIPMGKL